MNWKATIVFVLVSLVLPQISAAVPTTVSHQGNILDTNSAPVTGVVNVTFTIYDSETEGTDLWSQTLPISFDNGFYHIELGPGTPSLASILDTSELYLGITLEGSDEFQPRSKFTSVPYSLRSEIADQVIGSVTGPVEAEQLTVGTTDGYTLPDVDGGTGQVLVTDGSGNLQWQEIILSQEGTSEGQVLVWNGSEWAAGSVISSEQPSIVHRTASDFNAGTLEAVNVTDHSHWAEISLGSSEGFDLGDGSDGDLLVDGTTILDDGSPKQYSSVTVINSGQINVKPCNGTDGGLLDWKVTGAVLIDSSSSINGTSAGYRGGTGPVDSNTGPGPSLAGNDGESELGTGNSDHSANGSGGGAGQGSGCNASSGGAGGGHGTTGATGHAGGGCGLTSGAGATSGDAELTNMTFGGGGGGGSLDTNGSGNRTGGTGGNGGGAIRIYALEINLDGTIEANGGDGGTTSCSGSCGGSDDSGAGAGAGGSVYLTARDINLNGTLSAIGGTGGFGNHDGNTVTSYYLGGNGGAGRIRLDYALLAGDSTPSPEAGHTEVLQPDIFVPESGTFTSTIIDTENTDNSWGSIFWDGQGQGAVLCKVRSGNDPSLSDAAAWDDADWIVLGQDLSSVNSVSDGDQFLQYKLFIEASSPELSGMRIRSVSITR